MAKQENNRNSKTSTLNPYPRSTHHLFCYQSIPQWLLKAFGNSFHVTPGAEDMGAKQPATSTLPEPLAISMTPAFRGITAFPTSLDILVQPESLWPKNKSMKTWKLFSSAFSVSLTACWTWKKADGLFGCCAGWVMLHLRKAQNPLEGFVGLLVRMLQACKPLAFQKWVPPTPILDSKNCQGPVWCCQASVWCGMGTTNNLQNVFEGQHAGTALPSTNLVNLFHSHCWMIQCSHSFHSTQQEKSSCNGSFIETCAKSAPYPRVDGIVSKKLWSNLSMNRVEQLKKGYHPHIHICAKGSKPCVSSPTTQRSVLKRHLYDPRKSCWSRRGVLHPNDQAEAPPKKKKTELGTRRPRVLHTGGLKLKLGSPISSKTQDKPENTQIHLRLKTPLIEVFSGMTRINLLVEGYVGDPCQEYAFGCWAIQEVIQILQRIWTMWIWLACLGINGGTENFSFCTKN